MHTLDSTPRADGYRMPAEWEPHDGCWMAWPERPDNWRWGAKPAQEAFAQVATLIAASEPVSMAVSATQYEHARARLPAEVRVVEMTTDDAWMRDIGPTFVVDGHGGRRGVDWRFNAWGGAAGGLYPEWHRDDQVARKVLEVEGAPRYRAPIVLEGGSVHVDGQGTCLTTEECLLHPNRNPGLSRADIEGVLRDHLGVDRVLWLGRGVVDDETDGHVDELCAFVRPGVVVLTWTGDRSDPQHEVSLDARRRLEAMTDARGRHLEVHLVPSPGPLHRTEGESRGVDVVEGARARPGGERLAGSYANFYVANTRVVVPRLDERHDDEALEVLAGLFPGREVVGVPAREILLGGGNVHCITQQVPARAGG